MRSTLYLALFAILTGCTTQPPEGADAAAPTVHAPDAFTAPGHADVLREPDHEDHVIECAPDDAEPDGDAASATDVLDSTDLRDRTLCGAADTDWYRLPDVAASDLLELRAVALVDGADLDLRLYGPDGELLLEGRNAGRIETLLWSVEEAGDHYVEAVLVGDDDDGTDYDLSVTRELRPSECDPDPFEPNDGMDDARAMTAAWYEGFTLCPSDDDWYAIDAAAGEEIEILVDFFDTEGDVFAALFDPNGEEIAVGDSSDDDEHLVAVAPETGRYLLHVGLSEDRGGIPGNR